MHGCFWHSHAGCPQATIPRRNRAFWTQKFAGNRARDARVRRSLERLGYRTVVVWECELGQGALLVRRFAATLGKQAKS